MTAREIETTVQSLTVASMDLAICSDHFYRAVVVHGGNNGIV
jgi:hypothetical protein